MAAEVRRFLVRRSRRGAPASAYNVHAYYTSTCHVYYLRRVHTTISGENVRDLYIIRIVFSYGQRPRPPIDTKTRPESLFAIVQQLQKVVDRKNTSSSSSSSTATTADKTRLGLILLLLLWRTIVSLRVVFTCIYTYILDKSPESMLYYCRRAVHALFRCDTVKKNKNEYK